MKEKIKMEIGYRYMRVKGGKEYGYEEKESKVIKKYGKGEGEDGKKEKENGLKIKKVRDGMS